jgi:hypothetical protein
MAKRAASARLGTLLGPSTGGLRLEELGLGVGEAVVGEDLV